jgi:hypothetical protein
VGSWATEKNTLSSVPYEICDESYTTRTDSAWPVMPELTSSYDGELFVPPA